MSTHTSPALGAVGAVVPIVPTGSGVHSGPVPRVVFLYKSIVLYYLKTNFLQKIDEIDKILNNFFLFLGFF